MRSRLKSPIDGVRVLAVNPGPVETEKHVNDTRRLAKPGAHQVRAGDKSQDCQALGLTIPPIMLATADEVIE